jgi:uncharacterized RDD family membrane protein YckC
MFKSKIDEILFMDRTLIANFGQRLFAALFDLLLLTVFIFLLRFLFPHFSNFWFFKKADPFQIKNTTHWILSRSSLIGLWIIYSIFLESSSMQGTIGKQLMRIKVINNDGQRMSILQSVGRNLFKTISYAILALGFFYALVDKHCRGWHDIIARTLVVKQRL